jgi:hypothetical protein
MAYSWESAFLKGGLSVFDEATVETFERIQKKYSMDYVPFLDKMIRSVGKELSAPVKELKVTVQGLIRDVAIVLSGKMTGTGSEKLIQRIQQEMIDVEKGLKYIRQQSLESKRFGKAADLAERLTGVSLEELRQSQEAIGEKMTDIKPEHHGLLDTMKKKTPGLYDTGRGVAGSLATAFLGPFAGATKLVGSTSLDLYKAIKEKQLEKKEKKMAMALTPMSKDYDAGILESLYKKQGQGTDLQKILRDSKFGKNDELMNFMTEMTGAKKKQGRTVPGIQPEHKRSKSKITESPISSFVRPEKVVGDKTDIFLFFDKYAHKATWTRDMLDTLKKLSKKDAPSTKTQSSVPSFLPFLAAITGLVAGVATLTIAVNTVLDFFKSKAPKVGRTAEAAVSLLAPGIVDPVDQILRPKEFLKETKKNWDMVNQLVLGDKVAQKISGGLDTNTQKDKAGMVDPASVSKPQLIVPKADQPRTSKTTTVSGKTVTAEGVPVKAAFEEKNSTDTRFEKLMGSLEKLISTMSADRAGSSYHSVSKQSRDDASGTGDTRLDLLNSGALGLAD